MSSSSSDQLEERLEEAFDDIFNEIHDDIAADIGKKKEKRSYMERNREEGHIQLWNDHFSEDPTYPSHLFRRRFRMKKGLFMRIVGRLSKEYPFFRLRRDATGRDGLSPLQKCTAAIRLLAYGASADSLDEYLRLVESTALSCLDNFTEGIIRLFRDEYLRTFIQSITLPQGPKAVLFAKMQESTRKDVERAFGVLQARFAIVKNPALLWEKEKIGQIMRACVILHNMIVEDERDQYTQYDIAEFEEGETSRSSHVDMSYSTDMPSNLGNMLGIRTHLRDRRVHDQLKIDLIENVWAKFSDQY